VIRQNPYRHSPPVGWNNINAAPRDGTVIEIQNNWGVAPWFGLYKWVGGRGWQDAADERSSVSDGEHLSWRSYSGDLVAYVDPLNGAQDTMEYWDDAVVRATGGLLNPAVERAKNQQRRPARAPSELHSYADQDDTAATLIVAVIAVVVIFGMVASIVSEMPL
jgi:hypothetical protein